MQIIEKNNFYIIKFQYNKRIEEEIRMLPGRQFDHVKKNWKIPVNKQSKIQVESFVKKHGGEFLKDKTKVSYNNKSMQMPVLNVSDEELKQTFKLMPYDYQKAGIAYGLKHKRYINGDAPGLGKTAQSICTVTLANKFPALIICPSGLKTNWKDEWEMWTDKKVVILNNAVQYVWYYLAQGMNLFGQKSAPVQVFITNYESLKKFFVVGYDRPNENAPLKLKHIIFSKYIKLFKSVTIDESHRLKEVKTQQTKLCMGLSYGKTHIQELTGTPIVNKTEDLVTQLSIIDRLNLFGGAAMFRNKYCSKNRYENDLDELNYILNKNCYFRREKKDVLKDLPDKTRQIIRCDITNREEYNAALEDLGTYLKEYKKATDAQIMRSLKGEVMVRIGVLKNISARGKLDDVCEYINDILEAGEKLVVFIYLKEVAEAFSKIYPGSLFYTGSENDRQKNDAIQKFQECKICKVKHEHHKNKDHEYVPSDHKLMFVNYKSGGVGITLTSATRLGVVEWPWHSSDTDQLEDRLHRNGQKNAVQCTYFLGNSTFDLQSYRIIEAKRELGNAITGARNDVEVSVMDSLFELLINPKKDENGTQNSQNA